MSVWTNAEARRNLALLLHTWSPTIPEPWLAAGR